MIEAETLRVYHIVNPPAKPKYYRINSVEEAVKKIRELAQKDMKDEYVGMNVFGLEEFIIGEVVENTQVTESHWEEWYDEGGFDIIQVMDGESDLYDKNGSIVE